MRRIQACSGWKCMVAPACRVSGCRDYRLARQAANHSSFWAFCFHRSKVLLTGHYVGPPQPIRSLSGILRCSWSCGFLPSWSWSPRRCWTSACKASHPPVAWSAWLPDSWSQTKPAGLSDAVHNLQRNLKGKFSSGIEGALASTLNHDFHWKQLSEMILCIILLMFSKFIWVTLIQK